MKARWTAYSNGGTTIILLNGLRWGEVHVGVGFATGTTPFRKETRFEGDLAADQAWRYVLAEPLPESLIWELQDQAAANVLEAAA